MMRSRNAVTIMCLVAAALILIPPGSWSSAQTEREKALAALIEAERAFARTSDEKGIPAAFLAWLAPDAIVFRPTPVEGRPVYEKMDPANPAHLVWEPEVAEIAASGEMGYTSGPYRMSPQRGAEPTRFGHYVSVWKKQPDGAWKVFLDTGVQHGRPASSAPVMTVASPPAEGVFEGLALEAHRDEEKVVADRSRLFTMTVGSRGYRRALNEFAADDIRIYRPGRFPEVGRSGIKDIIPRFVGMLDPGRGRIRSPFKTLVAWSGDLACSYGTSEQAKTRSFVETTSFLKIWRKTPSGTWKICLDLELPVPADKEKKD